MDFLQLDASVTALYKAGSKEERSAADVFLRGLQNNPDMWLHILSIPLNLNTKFFALQILEGVIKYSWNTFPIQQRNDMKFYIFEAIVKLSNDEISFQREKLLVNKLNIILVQILKHEWPALWRSFIPDLVAQAKKGETICQNCMAILKLLTEEIFHFSKGAMTQHKIIELEESMNSEFHIIHELWLYVLLASQRAETISATLATVHAFLSWIPPRYVFESSLLEILLNFFMVSAHRNVSLQCLTEVTALSIGDLFSSQYVSLYTVFMLQLQSHLQVLESALEDRNLLLAGLEYLVNISYVDDTEVFKVCLEYWNSLALELSKTFDYRPARPATFGGFERHRLYAGLLSKLRQLMICRMAKPEEVIIVEDENGNIVRETLKDNDVLVQYKIMRETLIYLVNLDHVDIEEQMLKRLGDLGENNWNRNDLNTLCWAVGSISGSMEEDQEDRLLLKVIFHLLDLSDITEEEENFAVIASNIMYVVGQYPKFLRAHWTFLKIVVNKLFEFMHETHPGVQDMACDTFSKIVHECKYEFVTVQDEENEPFISELLRTIPVTIADLEPRHIHSFYKSVGIMIEAETDPDLNTEYLQRLMELPNLKWDEIIGQLHRSVDYLKDPNVIRAVLVILQTNTSVASSLGVLFLTQISRILLDLLNVYRLCSELISTSIAQGGPYASRTSVVKLLRSVKRETLKLIETFLEKCEDEPDIMKQFVPPLRDAVLGDYARSFHDARESEVLSLFATIINTYMEAMLEDVPVIFEAVFQCTLVMITKNLEDYPDHCLKLFSLLRAINMHCFPALIHLSSEKLKLVMDLIIWGFRHTERNIAETGLELLLFMLKNFEESEFCNQFYRAYFLIIEQEIFAVLTDTLHKPGFKLHVSLLQHLFHLVESDELTEPLWDVATVMYRYPNNAMFIREYTIKLLCTSFPNMTAAQVTQFVNGLFESCGDLPTFKNYMQDFLVQCKGFSAQGCATEPNLPKPPARIFWKTQPELPEPSYPT